MTHEMVHQWEHETFGWKKGGPEHGSKFMQKSAEINTAVGEDYVTPKNIGRIVGDGKTRPIVLIELMTEERKHVQRSGLSPIRLAGT